MAVSQLDGIYEVNASLGRCLNTHLPIIKKITDSTNSTDSSDKLTYRGPH